MKTPCIGKCNTQCGVCSGCGRTLEQIALWSSYSEEERQKIIDDLKKKS